jgi:hypothetical protein
MKKFIALLVLVLTMASTTFAKADVCVSTYSPARYHRIYVPVRVVRHWVPGYGRTVYAPTHRVLVWNRYHRCWM